MIAGQIADISYKLAIGEYISEICGSGADTLTLRPAPILALHPPIADLKKEICTSDHRFSKSMIAGQIADLSYKLAIGECISEICGSGANRRPLRSGTILVSRNYFQKIFDGVCTDLSTRAAEDIVETMSCPGQQQVQVRNANLLQTLGKAGALAGRNQFVAASMKEKGWRNTWPD